MAFLLGLAASLSVFGNIVPASAAGNLDQVQAQSETEGAIYGAFSISQTFTAGITGRLDQAALVLNKAGTPSAPLSVEIRTTSAGVPTNTVLATGTIAAENVPTAPSYGGALVTFTTGTPVTAGTQYALVAYYAGSFGDNYQWRFTNTNPYAGGQPFFNLASPPNATWNAQPASDMAFATFVSSPSITSPPPSTCAGLDATIVGSAGNDNIVGTTKRDVVSLGSGDDTFNGKGGNDIICGGDGTDTLLGGKGNDKLYGETGNDILRGGSGKDRCDGGDGSDTAKGCERKPSVP